MCGRERARGKTGGVGKGDADGAECPGFRRGGVQCPGEGPPQTGGGASPCERGRRQEATHGLGLTKETQQAMMSEGREMGSGRSRQAEG